MISKNRGQHKIPVTLTESQFNQFVLPYIPVHKFGPQFKISRYRMFCYIMIILYTGCQWKMLPIEKDENGKPEIHYTQVFRVYQQWRQSESIVDIFVNSVVMCKKHGFLETNQLRIKNLFSVDTAIVS